MYPKFFLPFQQATDSYALPEKFTFPFFYEPHPLSELAAKELQTYLQTQSEWEHNFGLEAGQEGLIIGKMFGVLVVQTPAGELGYLAAFSGKLAGENHHSRFVPPVFDLLTEEGFFRQGEEIISEINRKIEELEQSESLAECQKKLAEEQELAALKLAELKQKVKAGKKSREARRAEAKQSLNEAELELFLAEMIRESIADQYELKREAQLWKERIALHEAKLEAELALIAELKEERKNKSSLLQQKIFQEYAFLNIRGEKKDLLDIFQKELAITPPAGAGECAAPKLLQYAFQHNLKPIALAEFWWGQSPASEIRKHGHFYPACRGKCEPILAHMLAGMEVDENPMLHNFAEGKEVKILYEDEDLLLVVKPAEFLSVPGIHVQDSVQLRMEARYPQAKKTMIVHRLDMSTSGLMVLAKSKEAHQYIQAQFEARTVKKRYTALLEGILAEDSGTINLPLRVDLDNRPHQLVCHQYGKHALTKWEVIERRAQHTKVYFYPVTGRTHQLRVHASHPLGLNAPIVGDDLYGTPADRLHLHAGYLEFTHPRTKEIVRFECEAEF